MIRKFNLRQAALGALLLAALPGCDVLKQDPPTALSDTDAFANPDRIGKSAVGMYDQLQNAEFLGGRALIYSDIRSDDTNAAGYFGNISTFNMIANDAFALNSWTGGYRTLYGVNYFLQQIAKKTGVTTPALEAQYISEAKFIRALVYFHLVNLFAQPYNFTADASHLGVPIQLTAADAVGAFAADQNLSRSSVKDVYAQIEKDLNDAITGLPETYASNFDRTSRATKDAARTLLSRVYLYKGQYGDAATMAGTVISSGRHALTASPTGPFVLAAQTTENIFSVAMNSADNPNTNNALGQHYGRAKRGDIVVTPYARIDSTQFHSKDRRRTLLLDLPAYPATTAVNVFTLKYPNGPFDNVPVARYAEVLLNRAEGLAQTDPGVSTEALALLNTVRRRSLPAVAAYPDLLAADMTKQKLIDAVLFERRLELAFEGHRYYDLLRYKRGSSRVTYGDPKEVFPIPQTDLLQNPNLVQNPGY